MAEFVSVRAAEGSDTVVSVSAAFAEARGLRVLKSEPAVDRHGRPLSPRLRPIKSSSGKTPGASNNETGGVAASKSEEN